MAINGFRRTGIWPFNRDIFPEHEYYTPEKVEPTNSQPNLLPQVEEEPGSNLQLDHSANLEPLPDSSLSANDNVVASVLLPEPNSVGIENFNFTS